MAGVPEDLLHRLRHLHDRAAQEVKAHAIEPHENHVILAAGNQRQKDLLLGAVFDTRLLHQPVHVLLRRLALAQKRARGNGKAFPIDSGKTAPGCFLVLSAAGRSGARNTRGKIASALLYERKGNVEIRLPRYRIPQQNSGGIFPFANRRYGCAYIPKKPCCRIFGAKA